jgi:hemerythrin-like metal-binding protein
METSPTEIAKTKVEALQAMQEYGIYHFRSEENFMKSIGYPDLPHHWRLHKDFDYKVFHYIREIETGEVVKNTEIIAFLREWLIDHVMKEDMKIRQFLKKNSVSKETIQDQ